MASGEFNNASLSSDEEEEIFAGFTVEEVAELRQRRQRQLEQDLREDVKEFMDLGVDHLIFDGGVAGFLDC